MPSAIIALETATEQASVAVYYDGEVLLSDMFASREAAARVLDETQILLHKAGLSRQQLDAVAVGRGPGSFTGVRVAIALAQGLGLGLDIPVVPVSTLSATARVAADEHGDGQYAVALDARQNEIYFAAYRVHGDVLESMSEESLMAPEALSLDAARYQDYLGVGHAWPRYTAQLPPNRFEGHHLPHAGATAVLGQQLLQRGHSVAADALQPVYLRNKVAQTIAERARALLGQ